MAWMIALARSVDFSWSPPPYWMSTICDVRVVRLHLVDEAVAAVDAGAAGLVVDDHGDLARAADQLGHVLGGLARRRPELSVAAVVTGMSLSTPESNAITGIFASLACCSSGTAAWLSSAAKPIAAGFLSSVGLEHLDLLVDLGLGLGPLEGDLDVDSLAASLGALLHGLPELVLEALRDDRDVRLGRLPPAAADAAGRRGRRRRR